MSLFVLHVGCGPKGTQLPDLFCGEDWQEIRLDIDPTLEPDVIASMTDMGAVEDASVDGIYSSHNLEHLYAHEVPIALAEWQRVLKPGGVIFLRVPDVQAIATYVAEDKLEDVLYESAAGSIFPIDVLWGHRPPIAEGNHFMAHKTGFTRSTLVAKLTQAGFAQVATTCANFELVAIAVKAGAATNADLSFLVPAPRPVSRWGYLASLVFKK